MSTDACILTTKDFTILEVMFDRCLGRDDPLAPLLRRKLDTATVVFREDMPANVATLSSRVTFSVDGRDPDTRVLSHDRMSSPVGMFLPIAGLRGLALLGLTEGQEFVLWTGTDEEMRILLERVHYQPEAAKREREALASPPAPQPRKPALKLIRGAYYDRPLHASAIVTPDDPGPSAA